MDRKNKEVLKPQNWEANLYLWPTVSRNKGYSRTMTEKKSEKKVSDICLVTLTVRLENGETQSYGSEIM
jgi:hypothetical protein